MSTWNLIGNREPALRCMDVKKKKKVKEIKMNQDAGGFFPRSDGGWRKTPPPRDFCKAFWLFYWDISFLSANVHKAFIIHLKTICRVATELSWRPTFLIPPPPTHPARPSWPQAFLDAFYFLFFFPDASLPPCDSRNRSSPVLIYVRRQSKERNGWGLSFLFRL